GILVSGVIECGVISIGDDEEAVGVKATVQSVCPSIETFDKQLDGGGLTGDYIGVLLNGVQPKGIVQGQVLAKPGTAQTYSHLT
ncbi:MAG: hypothetical protein BYD32DRAFT_347547, partial [Podila humilis]